MYTPFAYAFAYAIKQTPYAFVAKIILCMYLLYALEHLNGLLHFFIFLVNTNMLNWFKEQSRNC